jgi:FKBP-type peptidyl-prolyl cis-trans isomerase
MNLSKQLTVVAGLAAVVAATYFGFGLANQSNTAQAEDESKSVEVKLDNDKSKLGYVYGAQIGVGLLRDGLVEEVDLNALYMAINDLATGVTPRMTDQEMQDAQQAYVLKRQQKMAVMASENQAKGDGYLASNKAKDGVVTVDSGLQYEILREGKGAQPTANDTVKVHYAGTLIDGTTFDSSYVRNEPANFPIKGVIPGFSEGLKLMKEGAKYRFVIPSALAYGAQGPGPIGPNQVLIFEVELLEVLVKEQAKQPAGE